MRRRDARYTRLVARLNRNELWRKVSAVTLEATKEFIADYMFWESPVMRQLKAKSNIGQEK